MKDEDILLPLFKSSVIHLSDRVIDEIRGYAREAVRMNQPKKSILEISYEQETKDDAKSFKEIYQALVGVRKNKITKDTQKEDALDIIESLSAPAVVLNEPRPFSLEAAKRGEPLVTRDGRKARFVAHVEDAQERKLIVMIDGDKSVSFHYDDGGFVSPPERDLFLAPKPKRTVWVNVSESSNGELNCEAFHSMETALKYIPHPNRIATAVAVSF